MIPNKKVKELFFPNGILQGSPLFEHIDIPGDPDIQSMSMLLFSKCGNRIINPIIYDFVSEDGDVDFSMIGASISIFYDYKWRKLYDTTQVDYNPIQNYNMEENEDTAGDSDKTRAGENAGTSGNKTDFNATSENTVYGFNSTTPHGDNNNDQSQNTESSGETQSNYAETETDKNSTTRKLTRAGNIGVMSTQQMIEQEREVANFNYTDEVLQDICDFIALRTW